jgi:hypothetical protein
MFCTACNTAFHWRTGEILKDNIHNPHYFEYLFQRNGGQRDQPGAAAACQNGHGRDLGGLHRQIVRLIGGDWQRLHEICRATMHLTFQQLPGYRVDRVHDNEDLRIQYLRGRLTEEEFKRQLQRKNKRNEKKREIYFILCTFRDSIYDIVHRVLQLLLQRPSPPPRLRVHAQGETNTQPDEICNAVLNEAKEVQVFCNDGLKTVSEIYGSRRLMLCFQRNVQNYDWGHQTLRPYCEADDETLRS